MTSTAVTVPTIDLSTFNGAATAILAALAAVIVVGFIVRMFRKA